MQGIGETNVGLEVQEVVPVPQGAWEVGQGRPVKSRHGPRQMIHQRAPHFIEIHEKRGRTAVDLLRGKMDEKVYGCRCGRAACRVCLDGHQL